MPPESKVALVEPALGGEPTAALALGELALSWESKAALAEQVQPLSVWLQTVPPPVLLERAQRCWAPSPVLLLVPGLVGSPPVERRVAI